MHCETADVGSEGAVRPALLSTRIQAAGLHTMGCTRSQKSWGIGRPIPQVNYPLEEAAVL